MTPAAQLHAAKTAAGLTWPAVSRLTGVPGPTLKHWYTGKRTPKTYTLSAVLEKLSQETRP